jgi:proline iminopeptidase
LGGSWGSTLALAYAQTHTARVTELVLRGIFTLRKREINWFYQEGASALFPDVWESFVAPIPVAERHDFVAAYHKRLTGDDVQEKLACARAWSQWEGSTLSLRPNPGTVESFGADKFALAFGRIESHYFVNNGFFEMDGQLIAGAAKLRHIPCVIIHGRYDVITPLETAWALHKAWPEAAFEVIPDAGHTATEPGITDALIRATDRFAMQAAHS